MRQGEVCDKLLASCELGLRVIAVGCNRQAVKIKLSARMSYQPELISEKALDTN